MNTQMSQQKAFGPLAGESAVMRRVYSQIEEAAHSNEPVLITGGPGTGKEAVARQIHARSGRGDGPFRTVNLGVLPVVDVGRTLFGSCSEGYGIRRGRCVREASGGVLYLDEIGAVPYPAQSGLLRMLRDGACAPSDWKDAPPEVRLIASSRQDLEEAAGRRRFRPDLLCRLQTLCIALPPLCERAEDIPVLAERFVECANQQFGSDAGGVSPEAVRILSSYAWPGNVRELRNAMAYAALRCEGAVIEPTHLPARLLRESRELA